MNVRMQCHAQLLDVVCRSSATPPHPQEGSHLTSRTALLQRGRDLDELSDDNAFICGLRGGPKAESVIDKLGETPSIGMGNGLILVLQALQNLIEESLPKDVEQKDEGPFRI